MKKMKKRRKTMLILGFITFKQHAECISGTRMTIVVVGFVVIMMKKKGLTVPGVYVQQQCTPCSLFVGWLLNMLASC